MYERVQLCCTIFKIRTMTKEEIRDAFKPQVVATRQELDIRMNELSLNRNAMMKPLQERLDALNKKKLNLRIEMCAMRIQLDTIKRESTEIEHEQREWKEFYKQLRYDWQALNPIERLEDDGGV